MSINAEAYFSFYVKPARIIEEDKTKVTQDEGVKLFDFG